MKLECQLTNEGHGGVGRAELVGRHACIVPVTILCHVGHCED